ncbi:MAG TPA: glycosyltransferase [Gaiellaceae bacterium]|nr:glycosyltransferase [Gaiellaceae bacterium]
MTLTAVVPATNGPPTLDACLEAIGAAEQPPEQVVVVREGDGPAAARNAGVADATGDVVVFVDADVLPHADAFTRIRDAFERDPELTAVFGSYDDAPVAPGVVSQFRNLLHHHVHQQGAGVATTFWAGLGAVRADAFRAAGGFDAERYRLPSVEDIELGTRLVAAGGRIVLDPLVQGTHLKRWTLSDMVRTDFRQRGVPWVELVLRHHSGTDALNLGWRHRVSALAAVTTAVAVVRGRPGTALCGLVALAGLNADLYDLLLRRGGPKLAAAGLGLHTVHHVTGAAAVPVGVARHLEWKSGA